MKNYGSNYAQKVWQSAMLIRTQTYISWCLLITSLPMVANSGDEYVLEMGVYAQQEISGSIKDTNGNPLPGVNIVVKGTSNGTQSDFDGNYSIMASSGDVLEFTFVGMAAKQVTVGSNTTIDVILEEDASELDEIVVIGYGSRKKSDVTGSLARVTAEDFEKQPIVRVQEALQGRTPGVNVSKVSGAPGGNVKIRVRGPNSITGNNDPLVVIDNFIGGDLNSINPNDIESIEVLKDASATAIYGSRGANGVILVTTKKGRSTPLVNIEYFTTISNVPNRLDLLDAAEFAEVQNFFDSRRTNPTMTFSAAEIEGFRNNGGTDYQDEFFRNAVTYNAQVSASGQAGNLNYFISGNFVDEEGVIINTGSTRYAVRSNLNAELNDRLKMGLNVFGSRRELLNLRDTDQTARGQFNGQGGITSRVVTWDPTVPVREEEGEYNLVNPRGIASLAVNPIAQLTERQGEIFEDRINGNLNLDYKILDNLTFTTIGGFTISNFTEELFIPIPNTLGVQPPESGSIARRNTNYQVSTLLNWNKEFGKHGIRALAGFEFQKLQARIITTANLNLRIPTNFFFGESAVTPLNFFNFGERKFRSFLGRVEYNYDDQLLLTASFRRDQSSNLAPDNQIDNFPSLALAYTFNKVIGLESTAGFSNAKLRLGWGQTGNSGNEDFGYLPTTRTGRSYPFDGSSLSQGIAPGNFGNAFLGWETSSQINAGIDLGFFANRLNLSFDWYRKNTEELLLNVPIPNTFGGNNGQFGILRNVGEVQNTGFDISITGTPINTGDFRWDTNLAMSKFTNEVVDLVDDNEEIPGTVRNIDGSGSILNVVQKGEPLGQFFGATYLGVWQPEDIAANPAEAMAVNANPGDARYLVDENGDPVLGAIGNGLPDFNWGFNNTLTYKNFDLNLFLRGVHGVDVYNILRGITVGQTGNERSSTSAELLNRWSPTNRGGVPIGGRNLTNSTRYIEDGSFVRLSNVALGYTLPIKSNNWITSARIYVSGQNLFTITDYSGYDPEVSSTATGNDLSTSIDLGGYPNPRSYTVGINLKF